MNLAAQIVLAHKGEEVLYVAIPLLIIFGLLALSARKNAEEDDDDAEGPPGEDRTDR